MEGDLYIIITYIIYIINISPGSWLPGCRSVHRSVGTARPTLSHKAGKMFAPKLATFNAIVDNKLFNLVGYETSSYLNVVACLRSCAL